MNSEIQPNPIRNLAKNIGLGLAKIVGFFLKIIFGVIEIIIHPVIILIVLILIFLAGFSISILTNDIDQDMILLFSVCLIAVCILSHITFIPFNFELPRKYRFINLLSYNLIALAVPINIFTWGFGVFTCNHGKLLKNKTVALVIDGKPITGEGLIFVNPFRQKVERIKHDLSLDNVTVNGTTKDGIELQALVDIQLRRSDYPENWKSPENLNPKLEDVIRERFRVACSQVTSEQIATSGLKLEFETGRDSSPENMLPLAVQRNGEVVVENIHARFVD